jgi:hypothetical protein
VGQRGRQGFVEQGVHEGLLVEERAELVGNAGRLQALAGQAAPRGTRQLLLCWVDLRRAKTT